MCLSCTALHKIFAWKNAIAEPVPIPTLLTSASAVRSKIKCKDVYSDCEAATSDYNGAGLQCIRASRQLTQHYTSFLVCAEDRGVTESESHLWPQHRVEPICKVVNTCLQACEWSEGASSAAMLSAESFEKSLRSELAVGDERQMLRLAQMDMDDQLSCGLEELEMEQGISYYHSNSTARKDFPAPACSVVGAWQILCGSGCAVPSAVPSNSLAKSLSVFLL